MTYFRWPPPLAVFPRGEGGGITSNALSICIQPDEGLHLRLEAKVPDQGMRTQPVDMEFHYESAFADQALPEAYERLLEDALNGDASLFIRNDHIEEAWKIVDPLIEAWDGDAASEVPGYQPGSNGPGAADDLLAGSGHAWVRVCGTH